MFNPLEVENGLASRKMRVRDTKNGTSVQSGAPNLGGKMRVSTGCRWMILTLPSSLKSFGRNPPGSLGNRQSIIKTSKF